MGHPAVRAVFVQLVIAASQTGPDRCGASLGLVTSRSAQSHSSGDAPPQTIGSRHLGEKARVVVAVVQSDRGLQAVRILDQWIRRPLSTRRKCLRLAPMSSSVQPDHSSAQVRWFNRARLRIPDSGRRNRGYLCTHGNPSPIWPDRVASARTGMGAVRTRPQRINGGPKYVPRMHRRPLVPLMPGRERSPSEARAETLSRTSPDPKRRDLPRFPRRYVPDGSTFWLQGQACRAKPGRWEVRKLTARRP